MNRRMFVQKSLSAAAVVSFTPALARIIPEIRTMRLGGPLFESINDPDTWIAALQKLRYRAAYCPLKTDASTDVISAYASAAKKAEIVIAEVGAWSNPLSSDPAMAQEAIKKCVDSLALAEAIGANCCVNISGSKNPKHWAGPHQDNLSEATFDQIVEVTRKIYRRNKTYPDVFYP